MLYGISYKVIKMKIPTTLFTNVLCSLWLLVVFSISVHLIVLYDWPPAIVIVCVFTIGLVIAAMAESAWAGLKKVWRIKNYVSH